MIASYNSYNLASGASSFFNRALYINMEKSQNYLPHIVLIFVKCQNSVCVGSIVLLPSIVVLHLGALLSLTRCLILLVVI